MSDMIELFYELFFLWQHWFLGVGLTYGIMNDLKSENKSTAGERILNICNGLQLLQLITQSMTQGSVGNKVGPKAVYARSFHVYYMYTIHVYYR